MSTNMARTPLAARNRIDPSISDGYDSDNLGALGGQNLSLAELRSPIEQMARTPQHIRSSFFIASTSRWCISFLIIDDMKVNAMTD